MKKRWYTYCFLVLLIITLGINQFIILEYNVNIFKYIEYSKKMSEEELAVIKKYSPLIYGGNINEPPLGMYYEENGQYVGLAVDHMSALSIQLGQTIISRPMVWERAMEALKNGETDLCDMIPSKERSKYYEFTDPIYSLAGVVVVKKGNEHLVEEKYWDDVIVGIQKSDYALEHIKNMVDSKNIRYTKDVRDAIMLLENGEVDVVVGDEPVLRYYLKDLKYVDNYEIASRVIYRDNCVIGVPKSQSELVPVLNKAIFTLKKNGTIPKINNKWISSQEKNAQKNTQKLKLIMLVSFFIIFITGYTVYLWNKSLKELVLIKTKELENTKNELEVTFNAIKEYIVILDGEGIIKNINIAYLKALSKSFYEVVDRNYLELPIVCEFEKKYDKLIEKLLDKTVLNEEDTFRNAYEFKASSGIYRIKLYPLEYETYTIGRIALMIEDITAQKLNQEKLTQENKMSAIGQLAAGVAHELRNPLGIMRNSTFLLNEGWDDEELRNMAIESIDMSIERSSNIINNLLSFSRKNVNTYEKINLKDMVNEISSFFNSNVKGNHIRLINEVDYNLVINTNATSLRHILMNLIQNAIDAIEKEGKITIYTAIENEDVFIYVEDNGQGIKEDDINKIFEPFYTTKDIGKGTGLGLYIVYMEISKLRGEISVESSGGKTVFTLKIPLINDSLTKTGDEEYEL